MRTLITLIIACTLAAAPGALAQDTSPRFTVNPVMARGPASAPVTIVEFSDYQ